MTKLLLLLLAFLIPTTANAQAMRPAPAASGPLITQPPPPGQPTYTPAGAGASHGGLATPAAAVPRSPNKRLLPPTKEAGIWAADGAPSASAATMPPIFGIALGLPEAVTPSAKQWSNFCAATLGDTAKSTGTEALFASVHAQLRRCLASRAYLACAFDVADLSGANAPDAQTAKAMVAHGKALVAFNCREGQADPKNEPPYRAMVEQWRKDLPGRLTPTTAP